MSSTYNLLRYPAAKLPRPTPEKRDGLLISPGGGSGAQASARMGAVLFLLGTAFLLSGFTLIMALISLILF